MRVYEFSKQSGISTKQILNLLHVEGFDISSHMSFLTPEMIKAIEIKMQQTLNNNVEIQEKKHMRSEVSKGNLEPVVMAAHVDEPEEKPEAINTKTQKIELELRSMTVGEVAQRLHKPIAEVILTLLKWGIVAAKNHMITQDVIIRLAEFFGIEVVVPSKAKPAEIRIVKSDEKSREIRLPVVAVLGHVDHGKTTLLDFIRKTRVAAKEKGGITQHLGAYEASTPHGNVVFIDTPGHEAFSRLRERGVRVADIVILVVAADDGIMPQTIEAIKQARSLEVPIIVVLNKSDLVTEHRLEVVKRELSKYDLMWEGWGGDTMVLPVSAKTGTGIDQLLESILIQAELMDLRANPSIAGHCYILESQFERGRGPIATILCQQGSVKVGDYFVAGDVVGHITTITDGYAKRLSQVGPSVPVRVAGFEALPQAGDLFLVISKSEYLKLRGSRSMRGNVMAQKSVHNVEAVIRVILKTDTDSSRGAILDALHKVAQKYKNMIAIVQAGVGEVNESDIVLADTTKSMIITFNVKPEANALGLAKKLGVPIKEFGIIYKLLEEIESLAERLIKREIAYTKVGEAEVRVVFDIKKTGKIAGSYIKSGHFFRGAHVRILRHNKKVGEGKVKSLQRDRKSVNEISAGHECAFIVDGFNEWIEGDRVECLKAVEV